VKLNKVISHEEIKTFQQLIRQVPVADNVVSFAVELVTRTRPAGENAPDFIKKWVAWGAGPRASQYLVLGAKTLAALHGDPTPSIDDVRAVALPVLRHRVLTNFNAEADGVSTDEIIQQLMTTV